MKKYLKGFWYSLPIQLFLLHFRRNAVILIFWYILFATLAGKFMENFGADSLYLAPEYYDEVNFLSTAFVGFAIGVFVMSWHITSFILYRRYVQFLASTAQPFLKFCINNSVIPILFLLFYLFKAVQYNGVKELINFWQMLILIAGFLFGFVLSILIAFGYFFGADKTIYKSLKGAIQTANESYDATIKKINLPPETKGIRVDWFFSARLHLRKPRDVRHYSETFLDTVFKRHHFAAVIAFVTAFVLLVLIGFSSDSRLLQIPAAASITIFFALLVAVFGALSVFLKSWSLPAVLLVYLFLNFLYKQEIIDPRNKAYGLNYWNKDLRPEYNQQSLLHLASDTNIQKDKQQFLQRLQAWKAKQTEAKPIMYIINTSGGGLRSANFTFRILQQLDSITKGTLMQKTILINGASGGMLGAAYFRELYLQNITNQNISIHNIDYTNNISKDLLNPLFSSFVSRDIIGPVQKFQFKNFRYVKDRGYAFEQKMNTNTQGILNKTVNDYAIAEANAIVPTMLFNSVISQDGRKMIICTQPVRFLMKPIADSNKITVNDPDAVDFNSFFAQQNSEQISVLSALRMNATFPFVLPNVWLPTKPVIDVMDAGIRDNYGQENTLRFLNVFKDWIKENVSKVVIISIRDRSITDWDKPYINNSLIGAFTKPAMQLQFNWFKMQDYYQHEQLTYISESFGKQLQKISFQYVASEKNKGASLSFHLTSKEKNEIATALNNDINIIERNKFIELMKK